MTDNTLEPLIKVYAEERTALANLVSGLEAELMRIRERHLPAIKGAVARTVDAHDALHAALEAHPELFKKPRTRTMHGIKVGYTKQRGKVEFADEAKTIERIRKLLPEDQVELLIRRTEAVHKPAVYDLVAADLKRLGITLSDDTDVVVIKPMDSDVSKLVDALLKETEKVQKAA